MGSLLLLSLLLLLEGAYSGGRSVRGRRAAWVQGPRVIPPSSLGNSVSFWVRLSPEFVAVPPGNSVLLNCSSSCPQPESYTLRTQLQHRETLRGPGWVSYQLRDVRAWSSDVHCVVTCAGERLQATARVTTYSVPRGLPGSDPAAWWPSHLLREPEALHKCESGQCDAELQGTLPGPRPLAACDVPCALQSQRHGGPQQL
uniref:Intercellular adhesion molecule N-terminal domain-containing protein n=1 Tax=Loxodonta africana TaxID=9785 RepID=G3TB08_LOXAF